MSQSLYHIIYKCPKLLTPNFEVEGGMKKILPSILTSDRKGVNIS